MSAREQIEADIRRRCSTWMEAVHLGEDPLGAAPAATVGLTPYASMVVWINITCSVLVPLMEDLLAQHQVQHGQDCPNPDTCGIASFAAVGPDGNLDPGGDHAPPLVRSVGRFVACCANGAGDTATAIWQSVPDEEHRNFRAQVIVSIAALIPKHGDQCGGKHLASDG